MEVTWKHHKVQKRIEQRCTYWGNENTVESQDSSMYFQYAAFDLTDSMGDLGPI